MFGPGTSAQALAASAISLFTIRLHSGLKPFVNQRDQALAEGAQWGLFAVFTYGLISHTDDLANSPVFDYILVAVSVGVPASAVVTAIRELLEDEVEELEEEIEEEIEEEMEGDFEGEDESGDSGSESERRTGERRHEGTGEAEYALARTPGGRSDDGDFMSGVFQEGGLVSLFDTVSESLRDPLQVFGNTPAFWNTPEKLDENLGGLESRELAEATSAALDC